MKFNVSWLEEKTAVIDAIDIDTAEEYSNAMMRRLGAFPAVKLLSIHPVTLTSNPDSRPPTPFGAPPSGTLGGGQIRVEESLPDVRAA